MSAAVMRLACEGAMWESCRAVLMGNHRENSTMKRHRFELDSMLGHILGGAFIAIAYGAFLAYLFINQ